MIPCAIGAEFQPGAFDLLAKPFARREVRLTEGGTIHTSCLYRTDQSQLIQRNRHSVGVDAQVFGHNKTPCVRKESGRMSIRWLFYLNLKKRPAGFSEC